MKRILNKTKNIYNGEIKKYLLQLRDLLRVFGKNNQSWLITLKATADDIPQPFQHLNLRKLKNKIFF